MAAVGQWQFTPPPKKKKSTGTINDTLNRTFVSALLFVSVAIMKLRELEVNPATSSPVSPSTHTPTPTSETPLITTSRKAAHLVKRLSPPITSASIGSLITLIRGQRGPLVFTRTHTHTHTQLAEQRQSQNIFLGWSPGETMTGNGVAISSYLKCLHDLCYYSNGYCSYLYSCNVFSVTLQLTFAGLQS